MYIILGREGSDTRVLGNFFKAVVQSVLLFGLETWVVTLCVVPALGGFPHRVDRRLSGKQPRMQPDGIWEYSLPVGGGQ